MGRHHHLRDGDVSEVVPDRADRGEPPASLREPPRLLLLRAGEGQLLGGGEAAVVAITVDGGPGGDREEMDHGWTVLTSLLLHDGS